MLQYIIEPLLGRPTLTWYLLMMVSIIISACSLFARSSYFPRITYTSTGCKQWRCSARECRVAARRGVLPRLSPLAPQAVEDMLGSVRSGIGYGSRVAMEASAMPLGKHTSIERLVGCMDLFLWKTWVHCMTKGACECPYMCSKDRAWSGG